MVGPWRFQSIGPLQTTQIATVMLARTSGRNETAIDRQAQRRDELQAEIKKLSTSRSAYIKQKVTEAGGADDSLDEKIYDAVKEQGASVGLSYESDSASY